MPGNIHPVRLAPVEIRDAESVGSVLVTTVNTSATGNYTATVNNDDGAGEGGRDLFIWVLAKSTGFDIQGSAGTQRIDSSVNNNVADSAALADLPAWELRRPREWASLETGREAALVAVVTRGAWAARRRVTG